ncbi:hypothetical protein DEJ53_05745 [Weissella confusa]|uniref:hypothetical protein n=1 Tax=Weissella confusa TaxID=1583 RepID=UPI000DCA5E9E|nr:hypothetical protein [Weissella confusa]RAU08334.1 hypothetical protein DEJ53_05745 [Weissella confusa]
MFDVKTYKERNDYGIDTNSGVEIKSVDGLDIEQFRKFNKQHLNFGNYVTLLAGKNGTMKSTLLGLGIHAFESESLDIYGNQLQSKMNDVFNLSLKKDAKRYFYNLMLTDINGQKISQPVRVYPNNLQKPTRFRFTLSKANVKGDDRFNLPVAYLNLRRLFPPVHMKYSQSSDEELTFSPEEQKMRSNFFFKTLFRNDFDIATPFGAKLEKTSIEKHSFGPAGDNAMYDEQTISAGEDNLGAIFSQILSLERIFQANKKSNKLTGILAIDEFDATLHETTVINLFKYILEWAKTRRVQVFLTSHELSLIDYIYNNLQQDLKYEDIAINFVTTLYEDSKTLSIQENPPYETAMEEISLRKNQSESPSFKLRVRLEDKAAESYFKRLVPKKIQKLLDISSSVSNDNDSGSSASTLRKVIKNYPALLTDTRSIVVFDADVDLEEVLTDNYRYVLKLPSLQEPGLPFEKEIAYWVYEKGASDPLFRQSLKQSRESIIQTLALSDANPGAADFREQPTKRYKNWREHNLALFNKLLTRYKSENSEMVTNFNQKLNNHISDLYQNFGINNPF